MSRRVALLIVGAGPAGMAAAIQARRHGLDVLVVDEQPAPGGQIWRGVETIAATERAKFLGSSYTQGKDVTERFRASGAIYEPGTQVWQIERDLRTFIKQGGAAKSIEPAALFLATGAQERPVPFPGWTLPGVLTVGAAQILLKTSGQIPTDPVWIAGSGPLPLLYLSQLLQAGGRVAGYLDTTPRGQMMSALKHLPAAVLGAPSELAKGLTWLAGRIRAGVKTVRHVTDIAALGTDGVEKIRYRAGGVETTVDASILLVHEGVVPSIHPTMALDCAHDWDASQVCFKPRLDNWGETSKAGIFVIGDGAGIGGATAAGLRGEIAALKVAERLGRIDRAEGDRAAAPIRARLTKALSVRPFLDTLYRPRPNVAVPSDETIACRCEEIRVADIRALTAHARPGPNQVKALTRAGMGPCQGHQCAYTVASVLADAEGRALPDLGLYRVRPPLKPITLGELAAMDELEPTP